MNLQEVELTTINSKTENELSDSCYRVCNFCDKIVSVHSYNFKSCEKLSGKKFFCPFCLRNKHHFRSSRNVLGFSFRGIIGYYYYDLYEPKPSKIYLSQIERLIEKHQNIGLQSPVLSYDPSVFMWYLDFNQIGIGKSKAPYSEVQEIITLLLETFNLKKYVSYQTEEAMHQKYQNAINVFYEKRKRPKERRFLIPTLRGLVNYHGDFMDKTRDFVKKFLVIK
jgi:hypothetical protein